MTRYQFNALSYERQLVHIFDEGTFLARRWEEEDGVNLYHLPAGRLFACAPALSPEASYLFLLPRGGRLG